MSRLPEGGRLDRSRTVRFSFDGRSFEAHPGDTLASGLLANGVPLMARSFKYHRPRGPIAAGVEEPNALMTIGTGARRTPNMRATQVEVYEGLQAFSQNKWPSLQLDAGEVAGLAGPLLSSGFYYKTFIGPGRAWQRVYEPLIRRVAGLGCAPREPDPDLYTQRYAFCDVLVVGGGAAGLAATWAAAESGAQVILADEQPELGGGLLAERIAEIDGAPAISWRDEMCARLAARANVRILTRTTVFGYFLQNFLGLAERLTDHLAEKPLGLARERLWKVRARHVVLATGAIEQPLVFGNNDRPGVMLAGAARAYVNRYAVRPGMRAVLFVAEDSGYAAARDLSAAGITIAAIADMRDAAGCDITGLPVHLRTIVADTTGHLRVTGAVLRGGTEARVLCDLVLMAGGWTPSLHLFSQSRGKLVFDEAQQIFVPGEATQALTCAGACRGLAGLEACINDGFDTGARAAGGNARTSVTVAKDLIPTTGHQGAIPGASMHHAFVDFQNDVTAADIGLAVREGFRSIEHVKRYTTTGMATDQGKTSNVNALAITAGTLGRPVPQVGLTTFRMPYTPVTFGAFAGHARGDLFEPVRHTPTYEQALALGGVFEDVGQWKRAHHFPRPGESERQAVARECLAVRRTAGLFDASTLGKIEVIGPDAAEFLDRMYTGSFTRLAPGRCRYGLLLNEAGFVMDDGIVARLAPNRFHVTTTTTGAARVLSHMEDYLQTEFTELQVWLTSITEQYAVIAVQGPRARDVISPLLEGVDLAASTHLSVVEARVSGVPARLFRVSYTGELGYEINVPADFGAEVWNSVAKAGEHHGLTPYGTETMHVLRAEKGYIVVGQDTDGTVTPDDLGMSWAIGKSKRDFVGARSLRRPDLAAPGRMQLVGLLTEEPGFVLDDGCQLVAAPSGHEPLGHVTSSYFSPALGHSIALALLADGRRRTGEMVRVPAPRGGTYARVVSPVFYDPEGTRLHG
ncbi:MAG: sarcosine oxidase subunit alpha family protein [Acetobacteraceae bacterium]|nr:sarcosine oxidase subunit alpha family protein [Acetobacteraceae bacterium]